MDKTIHAIPLSQIQRGNNDRTVFKQEEIQSLAESIAEHGLIQPITVNLFAPDPRFAFGGNRYGDMAQYNIIAGERRFRAVEFNKSETIEAFIVELNEEEASAIMLAENTARTDLDPIDEARAYQVRIDKFGWTIPEIAKKSGVSEIHVQFRIKLLALREDLHVLIRGGSLTVGYANIIADFKLDTNRQTMAIKSLIDNPRPTLGWFRNICGQYATQQNSESLFDVDNFLVCQDNPVIIKLADPAHPLTTNPPVTGKTKFQIIQNQIEFWNNAASS